MMMGASATVNHLVATHTMIRVVMMFEMHPRNCTTMPGKTMSMVSVSRLKRLMILPLGVVSKKPVGHLQDSRQQVIMHPPAGAAEEK